MIAIVPRLAARRWAGAATASIRAAQGPTVLSLIATRPPLVTHRSLATASESKSSSNVKAPAERAAPAKKAPAKTATSSKSKSTTKTAEQRQQEQEKAKLQKEKEKVKLQKEKEKLKVQKEKKEKERKLKLHREQQQKREKAEAAKAKQAAAREKAQKARAAAKEKEQKQKAAAKEKEQKRKAAVKEKEQKQKAAAKEKEQKRKAAVKAGNKWDAYDENGRKIALPFADKPRRINAFTLFVKQTMPTLKDDPAYADASSPQRMRTLSQKWSELSQAQKQQYTEGAAKHNATHQEDMQAWHDSLSPGDRERVRQFEAAKKRKQRLARREQRSAEDPRPRRPINTLFRYLRDAREESTIPKGALAPWTSEQAEIFRKLSPEKKQPYVDAYEKEYAVYRQELESWNQRQQA